MDKAELKLYEIDSESGLKEYIGANNGIIVGNNVQVKNNFYIIECIANNVKRMIGILNEGHGIIPTVAKLKKSDILIVASDKSLYILDLKVNAEFKNIISDSLIFDLIVRENEEKIVVICELGIQCMTITGDKVWNYDSDIISDFSLYEDYVKVTIEGVDYDISLVNGEVISSQLQI
ncbi:hypothetical protein [Pectinatus frisingensis]|nr:hypothetical protein [Pectinatus frisingensis]